MKEAVSRKKEAHMAKYQTEENKRRCKCMKIKANEAVLQAMREKAERRLLHYKIAQVGCLR